MPDEVRDLCEEADEAYQCLLDLLGRPGALAFETYAAVRDGEPVGIPAHEVFHLTLVDHIGGETGAGAGDLEPLVELVPFEFPHRAGGVAVDGQVDEGEMRMELA